MTILRFALPAKSLADVMQATWEAQQAVATLLAACQAGTITIKALNDQGERLYNQRKRLGDLASVPGLAAYAASEAAARGVDGYDLAAEIVTARGRILDVLQAAVAISAGEPEREWSAGRFVARGKATSAELLAACQAAASLTTAV